jgi:16S rRNA A1518/A1519 N6-dimethyltransferase RsmA/KsgA/DIM1 with predicted DNA glycosylase/AP lyase activity
MNKQRGGVALEFALVFPILVWIIAAGIELSLILYSQTRMEHALHHLSIQSYEDNVAMNLDDLTAKLRKLHKDIVLIQMENKIVASYPWTIATPFLKDIMPDGKNHIIKSQAEFFA